MMHVQLWVGECDFLSDHLQQLAVHFLQGYGCEPVPLQLCQIRVEPLHDVAITLRVVSAIDLHRLFGRPSLDGFDFVVVLWKA